MNPSPISAPIVSPPSIQPSVWSDYAPPASANIPAHMCKEDPPHPMRISRIPTPGTMTGWGSRLNSSSRIKYGWYQPVYLEQYLPQHRRKKAGRQEHRLPSQIRLPSPGQQAFWRTLDQNQCWNSQRNQKELPALSLPTWNLEHPHAQITEQLAYV